MKRRVWVVSMNLDGEMYLSGSDRNLRRWSPKLTAATHYRTRLDAETAMIGCVPPKPLTSPHLKVKQVYV